MYCWHCGTKLPSAALFCYRCGQSQAVDAAFDSEARPVAPNGWPWPARTPSDEAGEGPGAPEVAPPKQAEPVLAATASRAPSRLAGILGIGSGAAVVAGSFGPWVVAHVRILGRIEVNGSEGDGQVTFWCGAVAVALLALLLASPHRSVLGMLAAGAFFLAGLIGVADWSSVSDSLRELREASNASGLGLLRAEVGWGLQLVTFGGLSGTVLALVQALLARRTAR